VPPNNDRNDAVWERLNALGRDATQRDLRLTEFAARLDAVALTEEERRTVRRLADGLRDRGDVGLLSTIEVEDIRAILHTYSETRSIAVRSEHLIATLETVVDAHDRRLDRLEWVALSHVEVDRVRGTVDAWHDFQVQYMDAIKQMIAWWRQSERRNETISTFLATRKRDLALTVLILVPCTVLLTGLVNFFLKHL
jgi:hypothetical protein